MTNFKTYKTTAILCCLLAIITMPVHAGFILIFLVPVFAVWILKSLVLMWRSPPLRRIQLTKLIIWSVLLCSIVSLHWFYAYSTRKNADEIIVALNKFAEENHRYPTNIEEIRMTPAKLKNKLGFAGYCLNENHQPKFYYGVTYIPFDTYSYDFTSKSWKYRAT